MCLPLGLHLLQLFAHFSVVSSSPCCSCRQQLVFLDRGRQHRQRRIYAGLSIFQSAVDDELSSTKFLQEQGQENTHVVHQHLSNIPSSVAYSSNYDDDGLVASMGKTNMENGDGDGANPSNKVDRSAKHPFHLHIDPKHIGHTHPFFIVRIETRSWAR
jgi:hypothetical protein